MKIIDELLNQFKQHINNDMLIIKANLFCYQPLENLDEAEKDGLRHFDNKFWCLFQRIPDKLKSDKNYLLKISLQKLKRIKDQKITIHAKNIPGYNDDQILSNDDVKRICQDTDLLSNYLKKGYNLKDVPSCILYLSDGFLPSWTYKIIKDDIDE
jgi:hypothetical protein